MRTPLDFYQQQIELHKVALSQIKRKLVRSSMLRLITFFAIITVLYFGYPNAQIIIGTLVLGAVLFIFLVNRHTRFIAQKNKTNELIKINESEVKVANNDYNHLDSGKEFIDPAHFYSHDIDLFGPRSFFQFMNRTVTLAGKNKLATLLKSNDINQLKEKQEAVKNLAKIPLWRQDFSAIAALVQVDVSIPVIEKWLDNYTPFVPKVMKVLPMIISTISVIMMILLFTETISFSVFLYWFFVGLIITGARLKKINTLYSESNQVKDTFEQYYKLIDKIEAASFTAPLLQEQQQHIISEKEKTSLVLKQFATILNAFDQRNNMLFGVLANGLFLWDLLQSYRIEQWIQKHQEQVSKWFEVIAFFDAYNSLGNYAFNNPDYIYPIITTDAIVVDAKELGHPMLLPEKRVDNDICIKREQFFIITGANMAGKSTFLRTVALQILMSNIGLPICAKSCSYNPIKLISSMRTSDSLSDDASYFFSELTQLKKIVDALENHEYFIILDEILKGTNSKDKAAGSKKFVEKLVRGNATGIIATHDLSLCETAHELPEVKNKFFDAQIINDELYFDYTFKEGICQNMNASFLLKKMGIV
ncbi:DNA mismatch repair protein MutS [Aquimarina hainanensis]|uniref:DNA mismatch repair protein MutS n=1 Tax=Aquimarina hainanensis TaxID=1578017 RepID=A0ABW5N3B6_9FLAO